MIEDSAQLPLHDRESNGKFDSPTRNLDFEALCPEEEEKFNSDLDSDSEEDFKSIDDTESSESDYERECEAKVLNDLAFFRKSQERKRSLGKLDRIEPNELPFKEAVSANKPIEAF